MKLASNSLTLLPLPLIRFLAYFGSTWMLYVLLLCVLVLHLFPTVFLFIIIIWAHFSGPSYSQLL